MDQEEAATSGESNPLTDDQIAAVTERQAPDEIEHDAVAELERIHQASRYTGGADEDEGYDPSYGMAQPSGGVDYDPLVGNQSRPSASVGRTPSTLEDLYATYPNIGNGSFYLRVVRKQPTSFSGLRCAGWIEDVHEQMSMGDFAAHFGGHVYEVSVRGPGERASIVDAGGRSQSRTLAKIKLEVPGSPIMQPGGDKMGTGNQAPLLGLPGEDPRVQMKRLDLQAEEARRREQREDRSREELLSRSTMGPDILESIERAAEKRGEEARRAGAEVIAALREQNRKLNESVDAKEASIQDLRQELLKVQQDMTYRIKEEETRQVRDLRERHNDEIRRIKEDQADSIQRMQSEHQRVVSDLTERAQRERDHIQKMEQIERDRLRDDAGRREKNLQDEYARREREQRESHQQRLADLERSFDRELRGVREMRDREIESIRSSESGKSALTEKTAEIQGSMLQGQVSNMSMELESLRRENEDLRGKLNKPPMEAVREAHEIASMTGFRTESGEEDFDWKRGAVSAIKALVDKAPEIAQGYGNAREQNRVAVARAQQQANAARMRAAQAARQRGMAMAPSPPPPTDEAASTPQGTPGYRPPPPPGVDRPATSWDSPAVPPEPGDPVGLPDGTDFQPVVDKPVAPVHHDGSDEGPAAPPPPPFGGEVEMPSVNAPDISQQSSNEPDQEPDQEVPQEAAESPLTNITEEQINRFSTQLELAISTGVVTEADFARQFIEEAGPDATRAIIAAMKPDQLVDAVEAQEGSEQTSIVTRKGRKFVQQLWAEASKLLAEMDQGAAGE